MSAKSVETSSQMNKAACITEECFTLVSSISTILRYLQKCQKELVTKLASDHVTIDTLQNIFGEIQQLQDLYIMMNEKINKEKSETSFCLPDLFLDKEISSAMHIKEIFLKKYSANVKWIGEFSKNTSECQSVCEKVSGELQQKDIVTLDGGFYTIFNSLFAYEMIIDRFSKCYEEDHIIYKKTEEVKKLIRNILLNSTHPKEDFLLSQRELNLLLNKKSVPNLNSKFIYKGIVLKQSRKDEEKMRQLVLFSDKLYVTHLPNSSGKSVVCDELSVKFMAISVIQEEEKRNSISTQFGLNINTLETTKNFYFEEEDLMNIWQYHLQCSIDKEMENPIPPSFEWWKRFGKEPPDWQRDSATEFCNGFNCLRRFTVTQRRHHCRADGLIYCNSCSSNKMKLPFDKTHESRICDLCYQILCGDTEDEESMKAARNKLYKILKRKTRCGRKLNWLKLRVWNPDKNLFNPSTEYFCELDESHPILKLYKNCEDKIRRRDIVLLGMEIKMGSDSKYYKTMPDYQFAIEHKDRPEAYLIKLPSALVCKEWVESIKDSIISYCNDK